MVREIVWNYISNCYYNSEIIYTLRYYNDYDYALDVTDLDEVK
jgi:hypothetical protein